MGEALVVPLFPTRTSLRLTEAERRFSGQHGLRRENSPKLYDAILRAALTSRQCVVVALFSDGYSRQEVAEFLGILSSTVAATLTEARKRAVRAGLDPAPLYR